MTSATGKRAFTLVELLITIAILGVLAGLLLAAIGGMRTVARKTQAKKEVNEVASALHTYFMEHHKYPPDTCDWSAYSNGGYDERKDTAPADRDIDERSIHRYLSSPVKVKRNREATQQMDIKLSRLEDRESDPDEIGIYTDPWEYPYHMDCMHMVYKDGLWEQKGWPYPDEGGKKDTYTLEFKVVSMGPDAPSDFGDPGYYPFGDPDDIALPYHTKDDIRSW